MPHTLCLANSLLSSARSSAVTSSRKPSLTSPRPGCVLPQHNALPMQLSSEAAVRDSAVGNGRFLGASGRRKCTVKPTLEVAKAGRCLFSVLGSVYQSEFTRILEPDSLSPNPGSVTSPLHDLGLNFSLICEMGTIIELTSQGCCENHMNYHV